jgi:hypothetical protein
MNGKVHNQTILNPSLIYYSCQPYTISVWFDGCHGICLGTDVLLKYSCTVAVPRSAVVVAAQDGTKSFWRDTPPQRASAAKYYSN